MHIVFQSMQAAYVSVCSLFPGHAVKLIHIKAQCVTFFLFTYNYHRDMKNELLSVMNGNGNKYAALLHVYKFYLHWKPTYI